MEPDDNREYLKKEYWESRFATEDEYEWLMSYPQFKDFLEIPKDEPVLVVGCGSSNLPVDLHEDGYREVTSIDFSETLIQKMREKFRERPVKWEQMDMLDLKFPPMSFGCVIDKATMDVLQTDCEDPWNPSEDIRARVGRFYIEMHKVLKAGGKLIQISFNQPHFRQKLVPTELFAYSYKTLDSTTLPYFMFTLTKLS